MPSFWRHSRPARSADESKTESTSSLGCFLTLILMTGWFGLTFLTRIGLPEWLRRAVLWCADLPLTPIVVAAVVWGQLLAWLIARMRTLRTAATELRRPDDTA